MNQAEQGFLWEAKQTLQVFTLYSFCLYSISKWYLLTGYLTGFCKEWSLFKEIPKLQVVFPSEVYLWHETSAVPWDTVCIQSVPWGKTDSFAFLVSIFLSAWWEVKGKDTGLLCLSVTHILYLCVLNSRAVAPGLLLLLLLHSSPSCIWLGERGSKYLSKGWERWLICNPALPVGKHGGARELAVITFVQKVNTTVQKSWQKAIFSPPDLGITWKANKSFPAKSPYLCVTVSQSIPHTVIPDPWWDAWTQGSCFKSVQTFISQSSCLSVIWGVF